jgi:hypothetical protein
MIIHAIDPGKTAGYIRWTEGYADPWSMWQDDALYVVRELARNLKTMDNHCVIVERYTQQSLRMTPQYDALEMIGALRYLAWDNGVKFELQSRADKSRVPNDVLRKHGLWRPNEPHMMDAARHCLIAIARHRPQSGIMMQLAGKI